MPRPPARYVGIDVTVGHKSGKGRRMVAIEPLERAMEREEATVQKRLATGRAAAREGR